MSAYFIKLVCIAIASGIAAAAASGTRYERVVCSVASCAVVLTFLSPVTRIISDAEGISEALIPSYAEGNDGYVLDECEKLTEEMIYSHISERFPGCGVLSVTASLHRKNGGEIVIDSVVIECSGDPGGVKEYLEGLTGAGIKVVSE